MPASKGGDTVTVKKGSLTGTFGEIEFTKAGTYNYKIKETVPTGAVDGKYQGIQYDTNEHTATVVVADSGQGTLTVTSLTYDDGQKELTVKNTYGTASVKKQLGVTKAFSGRELTDADSFTFTLTAGTNDAATGASPMPASKGGDTVTVKKGSLTGTFGEIEFTKAGTYNYKIKETVPTGAVDGKYQGIQYDTNEHTATVVVADSGQGTLTVTSLTYDDGQKELTVKNTYGTASVKKQLGVTKAFSGRELTDADSFTFTLTAGTNDAATGASPMPASKGGDTVTVKKGSLTGTFGEIEFTKAGTYNYKIKETVPTGAVDGKYQGIQYDTNEHTATVVVADSGQGTLTVTSLTYDDGQKELTVKNTYGTASVKKQLGVTKAFSGRELTDADSFTFTLTAGTNDAATGASPMPASKGGDTVTVKKGSLTGTFGEIEFTKAGTYNYKIKETVPTGAVDGKYQGIQYDTNEHTATVVVADSGQGTLTVTSLTYDDGQKELTVKNTYGTASVKKQLGVTKAFSGRELTDADSFTFTLTAGTNDAATGASPMPASKGGDTVTVKKGSLTGTFGEIEFTKAGTYNYKIKETVPTGAVDGKYQGIQYDTNEHTATVVVADSGQGTLTVTSLTYDDGQKELTVKNTYGTASVKKQLGVTKAFSGRELTDADSFTFTLTAGTNDAATGASPMPASKGGDTVTVKKGSLTGTFGEIEFTKAGTYNYKIKETVPTGAVDGKYQGIQYDTNEHTATVVVADSGQGTLTVTSLTYDDGQKELTVKNTYGTASVKKQLGVTKAFSGRELTDADSFTFTLTAGTNDAATGASPMPASKGGDTVTVKKGSLTGTFGEIEFTKAGTYNYKIKETVPTGAVDGKYQGIQYDTNEHTATVVVADSGQGTLTVTSLTYDDGQKELTVKNTYGTASVKKQLGVTKAFSGRELTDADSFTFTLTAGTNDAATGASPMPVSKGGDTVTVKKGSLTGTFGEIEFTKAGTYNYKIKETVPTGAVDGKYQGIQYDTNEHTATVVVADSGQGTLTVTSLTYDDGQKELTVKNTYGTASVKKQLGVTKAFSGRELTDADSFTFTLTAGTNDAATGASPMPASKGGDTVTVKKGSLTGTFGEIEFTKAGTYHYDIKENASGIAGVTDDTTTHKAVVTVKDKDNNGKFTITVKYDDTDKNAAVFTDTYSASGSTQLKVDKNFTGRDWAKGDAFTFTLTGEKDAPMPTGTSGSTLTITYDSKNHTGLFGSISYTKDGTYTYDITENASGIAGVTDDKMTHHAVVTVEDKDNNGKFTINVKYDDTDKDAAVFTDTYAASGSTQLKVDKNFTGRDWAEGDKFTFTLTGEKDAPMPKEDSGKELTIAYNSTSTDHTGLFGEINYTKAGVYIYDITEKASGIAGVTDDTTTHKAVVTVEDKDHNGKFTITVKYDDTDKDAAAFTDTYAASGSTQLKVDKNFTGRDWAVGDKFTFTLKAEENAPMPTGTSGSTLTITYDSKDHTGLFGSISYTKAGTYTYDITEKASGLGGVTDDATTHKAVVTVEDKDHNGKFTITVKYDNKDSDAAVFTDTYTASGSTQLKVDKNFTGRDWAKGDAFTFTLTGEKDAPMPAGTDGSTLTITYDSKDHTGLFGSISYTKAGTYTYDITEKASGLGGVTDDATTHKAVVTVEDKDHNGKFTITVKYDNKDSDAAVFTDTYAASGSTQLKVDKNFTGRDWAVGDKFTFTLKAEENAPMPTGTDGNTLTITYDSKDHTGLFGEISYTKAGTYTYDITENASGLGGVTDDKMTHHAVVTVEDKEHNGKFTITVKYDNTDKDAAVFTDTYGAVGSITFSGTKTLKDGTLSGNEFSFTVKEGDSIVATGTNDKNGKITFTSIPYTLSDVGEHTYTVTETVGTKDGVQYDTTCYTVTVKVTDNHDGTLKIEPSSDYTKLNFTNTISSTTTSTTSTTSSSSVKTGDDSPIALYFILLLFSGAAAALFVTDMKKKKNSGNQ
jgi:pilin isopeptide linkage protein